MDSAEKELPKSAISSWGGFVYQGKVALYHCIKLLVDKSFENKPLYNFELQLDSTDDFAIYKDGIVISTHQVKAKLSEYRSGYIKAIYKAACIDTDCDENTVRYFHVAKELDSFENYTNSDGKNVQFYKYDTNRFCLLSEINELIDKKIEKYFNLNNLKISANLLIEKSTLLSEAITNKVIAIHNLVHTGTTQDEAAYLNRITSIVLIDLLNSPPLNHKDYIYQALINKERMTTIIENEFYNDLENFNEQQIKYISNSFRFIYSLNGSASIKMHTSLQPHKEHIFIDNDDIRDYFEVISAIFCEPNLIGLPHYSKSINKYLPTALRIRDCKRRSTLFQEDLKKHIKENGTLANLLYEYNNIIAHEISQETIISAYSDKITKISEPKNKNHIVKEFDLRILSIDEAAGELNVK